MPDNFNKYELAFRAWPILIRCAKKGITISYEDLASKIGTHYRPIRFVLDVIQYYCLDKHYPPLTILVVNKNTGQPGEGFIALGYDSIFSGKKMVFEFNWDDLLNPFQFAGDNTDLKDLVNEVNANPIKSYEVYRKVKVRTIAQEIFRNSLLDAYKSCCAFSGISFPFTLDAAHIIPWSESDETQKINPRNGILLSSIHHRLFDQGYMTIDEEYTIICKKTLLKGKALGMLDNALTVELHNKKMRLPEDPNLWPEREFIKRRNEKLNWK